MKYIDITKSIFSGMEKYPTDPDVEVEVFKALERGDSCNLLSVTFGSHAGTHIDAPRHIFDDGKTVDEINMESLICSAVVTDTRALSEKDFFDELNKKNVRGLLLKGTADKDALTEEQAVLAEQSGIKIVGTERMSIETSTNKSHPVHRALLGKGVIIVENLVLKNVKEGFYQFICLPLKIKGADGAPVGAVLAYD